MGVMNLAAVCSALLLAGCATSTNMRVGGEQSYQSIQDQREATRAIREVEELPQGSILMGQVDASRCHRYLIDIEPSKEQLLDDLKAAAYARGADGLANVTVVKEGGMLKNCWYIFTAKGTMFRNAPPR